MRACHARLHGSECRVEGCAALDGRMNHLAVQRSFFHALRPLKPLLTASRSSSGSLSQCMRLDFVTGTFGVESRDGPPSDATPSSVAPPPLRVVRMRLAGHGAEVLSTPRTSRGDKPRPQIRVLRRSKLRDDCVGASSDGESPSEDEGITIEEMRDEALRQRRSMRRAAISTISDWQAGEQALKRATAAAEAEEAERWASWQLAQQVEAERTARQEAERRAVAAEETARIEAESRAAAERDAAVRFRKQKERSAAALELVRDREGEWRGRAATLEQQLYEERRQPDAQVRSTNAGTLAARAAAERKVAQLEAENQRLARRDRTSLRALERERSERKAADVRLMEAEERRIADLRRQDAELRSSNTWQGVVAASACAAVEHLEQRLERARRLKRVQEAERLEVELEEAHMKLAHANSTVTSLRRNQSAAQVCAPPCLTHSPTAQILYEDASTIRWRLCLVFADPKADSAHPSYNPPPLTPSLLCRVVGR